MEHVRERVTEASGSAPPWPLGAFDDVEASVRSQLEILRSKTHLIEHHSARGFVYEVETGRLREVS